MIEHIAMWSLTACVMAGLIWTLSKSRGWMILAFFVFFLIMSFGQYFTLLSHPAPLSWKAFGSEKSQILGHYTIEDEGIYLLVLKPSEVEPSYYVLPWDRKTAEELQKALKEAEANGTGVEMQWPEEGSLERREPMFHALPQPAMPPKEEPPANPNVGT